MTVWRLYYSRGIRLGYLQIDSPVVIAVILGDHIARPLRQTKPVTNN